MNVLTIDIDKLPSRGTLMDWSRVLKASYPTLLKYRNLGMLPGERYPDRSYVIDKEVIIKCFKLRPKQKLAVKEKG